MAGEIVISVILPSYNEAENLEKILPLLINTLTNIKVKYEIIVVDTIKKIDNSEEVCKKYKVRYVNRKNGNDYGDAVRTGICESRGIYTIFMDSDGSHNPEDVKKLYSEMINTNADIVIGSRYCEGGQTDNNLLLIAMSRILNIVYKIVFNIKANDISNSFRIYKTQQLKNIKLECNNFDIVEEILIKLNKNNTCVIKEVPICFNKRDKGESKRDLMKFILSYIKTMHKLFSIKNESK